MTKQEYINKYIKSNYKRVNLAIKKDDYNKLLELSKNENTSLTKYLLDKALMR